MTRDEIDAISQAFHDGMANRDATALANLYAEDARFLAPNVEPYEGRAAIQNAMQQQINRYQNLLIYPTDVREAGDLTIEYGRYTWDVGSESAGPKTEVGKYVMIHEGQPDGSTKIVLDIFSLNEPSA